jgi:Kef-type K+ transport system membrane component KefB/nucleotide-binding universal stress UspA family protein
MTETFGAAGHNDILHLLVMVSVLLASARLLGELFSRLGQPSVVGEILAGVLLGPSVLGEFAPALGVWTTPQNAAQGHLLELIGLIGVMMLLVVIGIETDLVLMRRKARTALGVSAGGLILPLILGLLLGLVFPADLLADPNQRAVFALFLAAALSITAIPVLAKVLIDLGMIRRDIGQTMLAAAIVADLAGWTLLGIITSLASDGRLQGTAVLRALFTVAAFIALTALVGRLLVTRTLALVQDRLTSRDRLLTLVVVLAFAWAAVSQWLGLEPVIGAFAIGILFGQMRRLPANVPQRLESIALGVFGPIFFAIAGLKVDIPGLAQPRLLGLTVLVIVVATVAKVVGAYVGARYLSGQRPLIALAYGIGLNARGAVEIIIGSVGLALGLISQVVFSMIVVMAVVTSIMAPFGLRAVMRRLEPEGDEARRLAREKSAEGTLIAGIRRVLLPIRPRENMLGGAQSIEAVLLNKLARRRGLAVTLFSVGSRQAYDFLGRIEHLFDRTELTKRVVESDSPVTAVIAEAQRDYDLVVLGATEVDSTAEALFGGIVDEVVRLAPVPTLVVRGSQIEGGWRLRRIVVPTDGTPNSRRAAELAFAVADRDTTVTVVHVVTRHAALTGSFRDRAATRHEIGQQLTSDLQQLGESIGVATETEVRVGPEPEDAILETARRIQADLVILGTGVRAASSRLFLGPRVERILSACPCPVVVLNT